MSYNSNEVQWFSQSLLHFKDKNYGSEGSMSVSISFNTADYTSFSTPNFSIRIKNNLQKSININYSNALDLFETIKEIFQTASINGNGLQIDRRYTKNEKLFLVFSKENEERLVKIIIQGSETDVVSIVITLKPQFVAIVNCLKYYVENYFNLCSAMVLKSIDTRFYKTVETIPGIIKNLPSQIISKIEAPAFGAAPPVTLPRAAPGSFESYKNIDKVLPEVDAEVKKTEDLMQDFSSFLGKDMKNIKVDLIEEPYVELKKEIDLESVFITKLLENKLENLEMVLNNVKMSEAPILALADKIKQAVNGSDDKFTMFPGISQDDLKSIVYISTFNYREADLNNITNGKPLPSSTSITRYNPVVFPEKNMNISYDLFLINMFLRIYRRRMESKTDNINDTGANFHFQLRCFTDPFVFSFIDKVDKENFKSLILTRFSNYEKIGFFTKYQDTLKRYNTDEVTIRELSSDIDMAIDKIIGKMGYVENLHQDLEKANICKLPAKNTFTLEQITKELIPLEVELRLGKKPETIDKEKISPDVYKLLIEKRDSRKLGDERKTNLEKFIIDFKDDIPSEYYNDLINLVKATGDDKFDILTEKVPLKTFSEKVVKGLYTWDPKKDTKMKSNYKYFCQVIDDELMTKDLILTKQIELPKDSSWDNINFG